MLRSKPVSIVNTIKQEIVVRCGTGDDRGTMWESRKCRRTASEFGGFFEYLTRTHV